MSKAFTYPEPSESALEDVREQHHRSENSRKLKNLLDRLILEGRTSNINWPLFEAEIREGAKHLVKDSCEKFNSAFDKALADIDKFRGGNK